MTNCAIKFTKVSDRPLPPREFLGNSILLAFDVDWLDIPIVDTSNVYMYLDSSDFVDVLDLDADFEDPNYIGFMKLERNWDNSGKSYIWKKVEGAVAYAIIPSFLHEATDYRESDYVEYERKDDAGTEDIKRTA